MHPRASILGLTVSLLLLAVPGGCDKKAEPAKDKDTDEAAKAATPEPTPAPGKVEPGTAEPKPVEPTPEPAAASIAGAGFTIGAAPAVTDALEGMVESENTSLTNAGATVIASAHGVAGDLDVELFVRARVEFAGVDASAGLDHERKASEAPVERVFVSQSEVAKLPDGRWIVDVMVTSAAGEDVMSASTDHSLILVDASKHSAALIWSGLDTSQSEMGVCMTDASHSFAVAGDELVVSKTESTEFDAELAAEYGMDADGCEVKAKATSEVAKVSLAGK